MSHFDAIMIGAGHNGLTCAALLAKKGHRVLVLEKRKVLGGAAATEELFPGYQVNTGAHDAGLFLPEISDALELQAYGVEFLESPVALFAPQPNGDALTLWRDSSRNPGEIARFSEKDAEVFPRFVETVERYARVLRGMLSLTPPDLKQRSLGDMLPWSKLALKVKGLGKKEMMDFLRILPMSIKEFLDEWFESDALKGALGSAGVIGSMQGPYAAGTTLTWLYHYLGAPNGGVKSSRFVRGGLGKLSHGLAKAAQQSGAEIRTSSPVRNIVIEDYRAAGVMLENGEEIRARVVISNGDPFNTFMNLVGAPNLGPNFVRKVRNIRFRGTTAKACFALKALPEFSGNSDEGSLSGHIVICPSLEYLERAYDDAKYGRVSERPFLDITIPTILDPSVAPEGHHLMSINVQYAPYHLKEGSWDEQEAALEERLIAILNHHAPGFDKLIEHRAIITPLDWQRDYGLTEGSIFHGQMSLDQMLFMRPVPGFGNYRTTVDNLYLCGAGTHPGGGVTGAPGLNCAREVGKELAKR